MLARYLLVENNQKLVYAVRIVDWIVLPLASMNSFSTYTNIRFRQAFRLVQSVGWLYVFLILPFVLVVVFRLLEMSQEGPLPVMGIVFLISVIGFHLNRRDHDFLSRLGSTPFAFRLLDYFLLFIPVALALILIGGFKDIILIAATLPCLAWIRPPQKKMNFGANLPLGFIPVQAFEWRSSLRRHGWVVLLLYVIGLVASHIMGVGLGVIILTVLMVGSFYDELEEKNLLEVYRQGDDFLQRKLYWQGLTFHALFLPHYLLFLFFHVEYWYLLVIAILIAQSFLCFYLFFKYAHWRPFQKRAYNQVAVGLYAGFLLIPFLAPAALFYCWVYYRKAKKNLQNYYGQ